MHARFRSARRQIVAALVGLISLSASGLPAQERPRESGVVDAPASEAQSRTHVFFVGRLPVWDVAGRREVREGFIDTAVLRRLHGRVGVAQPAVTLLIPANTLNVDTTTDSAAPALSACLDGVPADCSLRGAVAKANTLLGGTQINVPAGTYMLTIAGGAAEGLSGNNSIGDLDVTASDVSIVGAGSATTIIQQTQANDRVLEVNPNLDAGFVSSLSGVTIRGGRETTGIGGGGIISGSTGNLTTISTCRFTDNQAGGAPGGAIGNFEGALTVTGSTFDTNVASSDGGAILFDGGNNPSSLTVTSSTFTGNSSASGTSGGGAILIQGPIGTVAIARSHFLGNQVSSATSGGGGAIANASTPTGTFGISFSRFAGNTAAVPANGKTLSNTGGTLSPGADDNWWGANAGPGANDVVGTTVSRWLQLRHSASPNPILVTQTTTLTADIFGRNTGGPVAAGNLAGLPAFPVPAATIFSNAVLGTLSGASTQFVDGAASVTYTAGGTGGNGGADATADSQTVTAPVTVQQRPSVTSEPTNQTVCAGSTATFMAAANGFPAPTVQWQVSTDGGGTFNDIPGAISTTLSFTAAANQTGNQYRAVFTNVAGTATSNAATLTVNVAPAVTMNPANLTVNAGRTATFTAAASGSLAPTVQWQVSTDGGGTFNDIPGATSTTLSFTATVGQNGYQYRAVFTNSCGTATSNAATLTATAGNNACLNADFGPMGQRRTDTVDDTTTERWYKVRLFADRSYAMTAWAPFTDPSEGSVSLALDWFADNCGGSVGFFADSASFREGVPTATGHLGGYRGAILSSTDCASPSGCTFRVRLQATSPGVSGFTTHFLITDTTLSSPYWQVATSAGYDAAPQLRNNVNNAGNFFRFIAYDSTGAKVCTFDSAPNPNGLVTFGMSSTCGISSGFGSAVVLHVGPTGTVTGNITTFSAASGLSFDSPFKPLQVQHVLP